MTVRTNSRTAPAWAIQHRTTLAAALAGLLIAAAVAAVATAWPSGEAPTAPSTARSLPLSREGARGHLDSDTTAFGLTNDARHSAAAGASLPESRGGVRGHVDSDSGASGLTAGAVQPSAAEPRFPPSREGQRGHTAN